MSRVRYTTMPKRPYPRFQHRHNAVLIAVCRDPAAKQKDIAKATGYSPSQVSRILCSPGFQEVWDLLIRETFVDARSKWLTGTEASLSHCKSQFLRLSCARLTSHAPPPPQQTAKPTGNRRIAAQSSPETAQLGASLTSPQRIDAHVFCTRMAGFVLNSPVLQYGIDASSAARYRFSLIERVAPV
jgi:hypothetical protein